MSRVQFETITDPAEVDTIKATPRHNDSAAVALRAGHVVWFPGRTASGTTGSYSSRFKNEGKKAVARTAERDGVKGVYVWLVDR